MDIGKRIAKRRKEMGFTQATLGEAVGTTAHTVWRWEVGKHDPERRFVEKLCEVLHVEEAYFYTNDLEVMESVILLPVISDPVALCAGGGIYSMPWSLAGEKIGEIDRRISTLKQQLLQDISTIDTDEEAQRLRVMDAVARWDPRKGTHRFNLIHPLFAALIDRAVVDMGQVTLHWRVEALPEMVVPYASTSRRRAVSHPAG